MYTPPRQRNTVEMPGNRGGANWGGALYVVSKDLPSMLRLARDAQADQRLAEPAESPPTGFRRSRRRGRHCGSFRWARRQNWRRGDSGTRGRTFRR